MSTQRARRLGAAFGVIALLAGPDARPAFADAKGGPSVRNRGPGCADSRASFDGFAGKQRALRTISSGFRETRTLPGQQPVVASGRLTFKAPNLVRWEIDPPDPFVVETQGGNTSAGKPGNVQSVDPTAMTPTEDLFRDLGILFTATEQYVGSRFDTTEGPDGPQTMRLVPRNRGKSETVETVDLEVDPSTGLLRRAVIHEKDGTRTEVQLIEAIRDQPVDPDR